MNTPHRLTSNVKLMHKVVIRCQDRVLMLQRAADDLSRPGKWDLPGGNSEWPTDLEQAIFNPHQDDVTREIVEETGLVIPPQYFDTAALVLFETYFDPAKKVYSIVCGWLVVLDEESEPPVQLSHEHQEFRWVPLEEAQQLDFGSAAFLPRILQAAVLS